MQNFRKLEVYEESMALAVRVLRDVMKFQGSLAYSLGSQMMRSATSVPSNIAEGAGRKSQKGKLYFWNVALTSAYELEAQLEICQRSDIPMNVTHEEVAKLANRLRRLIECVPQPKPNGEAKPKPVTRSPKGKL